jgi:hypothetical protein
MENNIFKDLKIVEFAWVIVGPSSTRYMAEHVLPIKKSRATNALKLLDFYLPIRGKPGLNRSMYSR